MDKYTIKRNEEYKIKIEKGEYRLLAIGNGNFDYYINVKNTVYSIAKTNECCSSYYGALEYFFNRYIYNSYKDIKLTKEAYSLLLSEIKSSYYYRCIERDILNNVTIL
jgi:hypothetical protein